MWFICSFVFFCLSHNARKTHERYAGYFNFDVRLWLRASFGVWRSCVLRQRRRWLAVGNRVSRHINVNEYVTNWKCHLLLLLVFFVWQSSGVAVSCCRALARSEHVCSCSIVDDRRARLLRIWFVGQFVVAYATIRHFSRCAGKSDCILFILYFVFRIFFQ